MFLICLFFLFLIDKVGFEEDFGGIRNFSLVGEVVGRGFCGFGFEVVGEIGWFGSYDMVVFFSLFLISFRFFCRNLNKSMGNFFWLLWKSCFLNICVRWRKYCFACRYSRFCWDRI